MKFSHLEGECSPQAWGLSPITMIMKNHGPPKWDDPFVDFQISGIRDMFQ